MNHLSTDSQSFEVTAYTFPDTFEWTAIHKWTTYNTASVDYERVAGVSVDDGIHMQCTGDTSSDLTPNVFEMPYAMADGLLVAMNRVINVDIINCHLFSRLLHPDYTELARSQPGGRSWHPIENYSGRPATTKLGMGAVGVVGLQGRGSVHSLVGLGEESGLGIQILSHGAELAIVSNDATLDFYQKLYPETTVGIYLVD